MSSNGGNGNEANASIQNSGANNESCPLKQNGDNIEINGSSKVEENQTKPKAPGDLPLSPGKDISPDSSFEEVHLEVNVNEDTYAALIRKMVKEHYDISVGKEPEIHQQCKYLFQKDYICKEVHNRNYSMNYPERIMVPVANVKGGSSMDFDENRYAELVKKASQARLRSRFVAPVMLFDNKFICRSGTLTVTVSAMYESATKPSPAAEATTEYSYFPGYPYLKSFVTTIMGVVSTVQELSAYVTDWAFMVNLFTTDIEILKLLKVERICDLMVEYTKHFKNIFNVSATEAVHFELYKHIKMEEMPYPGCEFFTLYHKSHDAQELKFDWDQVDVTRKLKLTGDPRELFPEINIADYKTWNLILLTQNYLKIMLYNLVTGTGGMVVHCISGWDRTPLFISLLRLSLWADGVVHENLNFMEIGYLTLAYDWFLFGHNLPNRLGKDEEVMHFCFNFLENITTDEFSVTRLFQELPAEKKRDRKFPDFTPGRRVVLDDVRRKVLEHYSNLK